MRILQIVHGFPSESNAGTERYCEAVCAQLRSRGHTVAVFAGTGQPAAKATTVTTERDGFDVTRYYRADGRDYGWMDGYDPEVEQVLRSTLASCRPDIVHVHHWHRLTNNLVAICADLGIPGLDIVGGGGDLNARARERRDAGEPARRQHVLTAPLEVEIGRRQRDDANVEFENAVADARENVVRNSA